jgi:electron transfer flavoprotein alpha subunit
VAVDLGWIPWERQVGQSGCTVAPALYLACGISGASQHLAGIRGARTIVAINTDRAAPILDMAHLGVVGDWQPVVARLAERLRARQDAVPSPPSTPT